MFSIYKAKQTTKMHVNGVCYKQVKEQNMEKSRPSKMHQMLLITANTCLIAFVLETGQKLCTISNGMCPVHSLNHIPWTEHAPPLHIEIWMNTF